MRKLRFAHGLIASVVIIGILVLWRVPISALLVVAGPGYDIFELDGNGTDDANVDGDDWNTTGGDIGAGGARTKAFIADCVATETTPCYGNATIFTGGGSKDAEEISQWAWKDDAGGLPDKDNIENAYARAYDVNGDQILYFGLDRFTNNGDAQLGFWFFHKAIATVGTGQGTFSGEHQTAAEANSTVGDVLILANLSNGGAQATIQVLEWVGEGNGDQPQAGGPLKLIRDDDNARCDSPDRTDPDVCAITNISAVTVPANNGPDVWKYKAKTDHGKSPTSTNFPSFSFFEGGLNTTDLFGGEPCFASFLAETRSSDSVSAVLKDFALGAFPVCGGSLKVVKKTVDRNGNEFAGTGTFPYKVARADGTAVNFDGDLELTATLTGNNDSDSYSDMKVANNFTLVEGGGNPAVYCTAGNACTPIDPYVLVSIVCVVPGDANSPYTITAGGNFPIAISKETTCTITNKLVASPSADTAQTVRLYDSVHVSGFIEVAGAKAVTFKLYSATTCIDPDPANNIVGNLLGTDTASITYSGTAADAVTPNGVKPALQPASSTYYWRVFIPADNFNGAIATSCGSETTAVTFTGNVIHP
jgi:hypothetical protein